MRIGVLINDVHGGGAEFTARRWAGGLTARSHEIHFYTYKHSPAQPPDELAGIEVTNLSRTATLLRHPLLLRTLARRVERDDLDVLLTMGHYASVVALTAKRFGLIDVPVAVSERNVHSLVHAERGLRQAALRWLARRLYRTADGIIAISHPVAADVLGSCRVAPERIFVVPNPVLDRPSVSPLGNEINGPSQLAIGFVGRLEAQKRPVLFVETLAALATRGFTVKGVILGAGSLEDEMKETAKRLGTELDFRGWSEPWSKEVDGIACIVLPSAYEGFGNVLVEAASIGIPVVAPSEALGVADAIIPGVTGQFARTAAPEDLADAVQSAILTKQNEGAPIDGWFRWFSLENSTMLLEKALISASS